MKRFLNREHLALRPVRFSLLGVGAVLLGLSLVFDWLFLLAWVGLIPACLVLFAVCDDPTVRLRGLYGYGFFFFWIFYAVNFHWFVALYPLDFVEGMTPLAALAVVLCGCVGLAALQALLGGLTFVLLGFLMRSSLGRRFPILVAPLFASLWAILEWSQTLTWAGVPWARLGIGQVGFLPFVQTASLFGCCFLSFLIVCVNALLAYALYVLTGRSIAALLALSLFLANAIVGSLLYVLVPKGEKMVSVGVVQGNIPSQEKWDSSMSQRTREHYREGTIRAAELGAEVVIWPETALPYTIYEGDSNSRYLSSLAREAQVTVIAGVLLPSEEGGDYNSLLTVLPDGSFHETVYSKRRLVPFGEFVPMRGLVETLIPPLAELSMLSEDCVAGESASVIELPGGVRVGGLICFDSIYDELARDSAAEGADLLAVSTNDSWFLDSRALHMHHAQARLRAVENGRSVVRSANTGISSLISPKGEVIESLDVDCYGVLVGALEVRDHPTLYTLVGNLFVYVCIGFVGVLLCIPPAENIKKHLTQKEKSDKIIKDQ